MGFEYLYFEYDPAKPLNRLSLNSRKLVRAIDLTNVEGPSYNSLVRGSLQITFTTTQNGAIPYGMNVPLYATFPLGATGVITPGDLPIMSNVRLDVTPYYTQVYTLTVTHNGVYDTRQLTISVMQISQPTITSFGRSGSNASLYITENTSVTLRAVFDHGTNHQGSAFAQITPGDAQGPYEIISNGTLTIPVGTRGSVTYTLTVLNNFTNVGITASITVNAVALPNIISFDRMNALSSFPLYITNSPETVTLRAVFVSGSGQLIAANGTVLVSNIFTNTNFNVAVSNQTYTLRVTSLAGAITETTLTFTIAPTPVPPLTFTSNINNIAPNATVILSVSSYSSGYAEIEPGNLSIASGGSVPVNPSSTQIYTLKMFSFAGVLDPRFAYVTVTVVTPAIQSFDRIDSVSNAVLSNQVSPGNYNLRAFFTNGSGVLTASPTIGSYNINNGQYYSFGQTTGTRVYTLTVTNSNGASVSRDLTIVVVPNPVINGFNQSASTVAPNTDVTLTVNYTGGTGIITPGNLSVSLTGTVVVRPAITTPYTLTVTNSLGVSTAQQLTINVGSLPIISSFNSNVNNVSPGLNVTLLANFTGGTGSVSNGVWYNPIITSLVVAVPTTTTYTLTVTNASGSVQRTHQVIVVPDPVINGFSQSDNNVAPNTGVTLTVNYTGGTGIITPGNLSVLPTDTVVVNPSTTTPYTLTVTNSIGVVTTQQLTIDVVTITPDLGTIPDHINLGQTFQVFYMVPINTSVTLTFTSQAPNGNNVLMVSGTDFNIDTTYEDTTSVPGARQVLIDYQLAITELAAFNTRYFWNYTICHISLQGQGINLSTQLFIEGDP
jgi:hypothetical protein